MFLRGVISFAAVGEEGGVDEGSGMLARGGRREAKRGTTTVGRIVESGGFRGVNLIISSCQKPGSDTA